MSIFKNIFGTHCDFFSDRVCRIYTVLLFLIVAVVLAIELQHTSPMTCWTPAYFTNQHYAFTVNICENSGDLYNISTEKDGRIDKMIKYTPKKLKYLPVTLAGQSLLFLLPWLLWRFISHVSGSVCNLEAVVKESNKVHFDIFTCKMISLNKYEMNVGMNMNACNWIWMNECMNMNKWIDMNDYEFIYFKNLK